MQGTRRWWAVSMVVTGLASMPAAGQKRSDPGKGVLTQAPEAATNSDGNRSHSSHGAAFDQGPRQRAHPLQGIGNVHFAVTTRSLQAQRFFDQGVNLLYSFSWYEAERAFRQAGTFDPDCAMAYWGMAMADSNRGKEFLALAQPLKAKATDRERRYIDALAIVYGPGDEKQRTADNIKALERLVLAYPDDIDAKAILAWALESQQFAESVSHRVAVDALLRAVLQKNPKHPGALHYRIHMWDGPDAAQALDSAQRYAGAAPAIGHAQHMPGHIFAQLGMWAEAAHAMDAAARAERRYFYAEHRLPYESWNYAHNQHYLVTNLGFLGRIDEGARLARELLDAPRDPRYNDPSNSNSICGQGRFAMMRMRIRGERWDDVLNDPEPGWTSSSTDKGWSHYTRGMAFLGKGDGAAARRELAALEKLKVGGDAMTCAEQELRGLVLVREGQIDKGLAELKHAADTEKAKFAYSDPGPYPHPLYESLADAFLGVRRYADAEVVLTDGLTRQPRNGFALCQLTLARAAMGKTVEARTAFAQLRAAWPNVDRDLPSLQRFRAQLPADLAAEGEGWPADYRETPDLTAIGPRAWRPFAAPALALADPAGKAVRLADYRGRPLLLVFYLGGICKECMAQLDGLGKEKSAFAALGVEIAAVSSDSPEMVRAFLKQNPGYPLRLLCDTKGATATRYGARDEFENLDLHGTVLLTGDGRVWWYRTGSEPFTGFSFLKSEIARMKAWEQRDASRRTARAAASHP